MDIASERVRMLLIYRKIRIVRNVLTVVALLSTLRGAPLRTRQNSTLRLSHRPDLQIAPRHSYLPIRQHP